MLHILMKLEVAERALQRIALNISGDTVPQVVAGEALDTMRKPQPELQSWLLNNKPPVPEPPEDPDKATLKEALARKYL